MKDWTVKMCNIKDLCSLYELTYRSMKLQLKPYEKELGPKQGTLFNIKQVLRIIEILGEPATVIVRYPSTYQKKILSFDPSKIDDDSLTSNDTMPRKSDRDKAA